MVLVAFLLLVTGLLVGLLGQKLFRVLLPLLGLVGGTVVGFVGFQAVFGTSALSTTMAVFVAVIVGLVLALLSFLFFELALTIAVALLGASAFSYLGIALGLQENGFVLFLLSLAGFVLGLAVSSSAAFSASFVISITAFAGAALVLSSTFLIAGSVTLTQLYEEGIIRTVLNVVDQSFLWFFVWLTTSLIAAHVQRWLLVQEVMGNRYQFEEV
jgi:hypothetical protein